MIHGTDQGQNAIGGGASWSFDVRERAWVQRDSISDAKKRMRRRGRMRGEITNYPGGPTS